jgi:hypothetical protein
VTEKAFKRQKKRVQKYLRHWKILLGLGVWRIDVEWYDGRLTETRGGHDSRDTVLADIHVSWEYLKATMRVNIEAVSKLSDEQLEEVIIHELLHAVVNEMRNFSADDGIYHEERVVSTLTSVIGWVRDHYQPEPATK